MSDWTKIEFGNLFEIIYRYPTYYGIKYTDKGVKEVRGELLSSNGQIDDNCRYIFDSTAARFPKVRLKEDDIIISVRGTLGKIGFVDSRYIDAVITANLLRLSPNKSKVDARWLLQTMIGEYFRTQLDFASSQTTIKTIQIPQLTRIAISLPSREEQKKIASILTTADNLIEKTEALIHKYQQIKAGLMHDLFTRGLTADGKLRPTREQAPELYQETPIGWIPKEWAVMDCASIFDIDSGITLGAHRRPEKNPYPYLRVANVFREEIRTDEILKLEASETEIQQYGLRKYDLLLVEGHANVREIGRCAMVIDNAEGLLFQNHLFRLRSVSMDPYYALYCLNSHYARKYWEGNCSTSSGLNTINRRMLGNMMLCVPELKEQEAVARVLNAQNFHIGAEKQNLAKIKKLKFGIMHDLLTGQVRVKVDDSNNQEAAA